MPIEIKKVCYRDLAGEDNTLFVIKVKLNDKSSKAIVCDSNTIIKLKNSISKLTVDLQEKQNYEWWRNN